VWSWNGHTDKGHVSSYEMFVCLGFEKGHCLKGNPLWERMHENSVEFFKPVTFRH
jgi:hypothetical protein